MMSPELFVGKIVTAVYLAQHNDALRLDLANGHFLVGTVEADCCSSTWIEEVDSPERLIDQPIVAVRELRDDEPANGTETDEPNQECVSYYGQVIQTPKGDVVIDFRNESNGYYGGDLCWAEQVETPSGQWRKLA